MGRILWCVLPFGMILKAFYAAVGGGLRESYLLFLVKRSFSRANFATWQNSTITIYAAFGGGMEG